MDPKLLAQSVVAFLSPFLPYLVKAGEKAIEEAGKKFGAEAWEQAQALWAKLRSKVQAKPAAHRAAQDVAKAPNNEDARVVLRVQLKNLLAEDGTLAAEIARLMQARPREVASTVIQQQAGDDAIQVGQARDVKIQR